MYWQATRWIRGQIPTEWCPPDVQLVCLSRVIDLPPMRRSEETGSPICHRQRCVTENAGAFPSLRRVERVDDGVKPPAGERGPRLDDDPVLRVDGREDEGVTEVDADVSRQAGPGRVGAGDEDQVPRDDLGSGDPLALVHLVDGVVVEADAAGGPGHHRQP